MNETKNYLSKDGVIFYTQKLKNLLDDLLAKKADKDGTEADIAEIESEIAEIQTLIDGLEESKVDKVSGKGLSTEDYTTAEKTKLAGVEADADVNIIETVKVNNTPLTPDANKAVNVSVPTDVSQLNNDSNYQTGDEVASAISEAIAGVTQIRFEIVQELPQTGVNGVIYLIQYAQTPEGNVYQEWIWLSNVNKYETLGSTNQIDLTNYVTFDDLVAVTNTEITNIFNQVFPSV